MNNQDLFERAQRVIPAGVNSPVRAFRAVGGTPPFFERASGAHLWDAEGRRYIDYLGSWGPMVAGHTHPAVVEAVQEAANELGASGYSHDDRVSKVSAVGHGMARQTGVAQKMFRALADAGVNILVITTSEIKISVVINLSKGEQAMKAVHAAFLD